MRSLKMLGFALLSSSLLTAQSNTALTRDEVTVLKKKLVALVEALGQPPKGYVKEDEDFNLPTDFSKVGSTNMYYPVNGSVQVKFGGGAEKLQKKTEKESQDYQKKIAEAQAKGDYETMSKLALEMQKKMGEAQAQVIGSTKEPIAVSISFNQNPGQTIDPDAVVFEKPGALALKFKENEAQEKIRIVVYVDPVSLKDTKQLSRVDLALPNDGIKGKTGVLSVTIEFDGPAAQVEQWSKDVSLNKVLAQIDRK